MHSPIDAATELERAVRSRYRVSAHVVPVPDSTSDIDRLERVAMSAAHVLTGFVESNMIVGVAWGSTTSAIARHLVPKDTHDTTVVQLNGAGNTRTTGIAYASEILQHFGEAYHAQVQQFPVPAFFDDPATKEAVPRATGALTRRDGGNGRLLRRSADSALGDRRGPPRVSIESPRIGTAREARQNSIAPAPRAL